MKNYNIRLSEGFRDVCGIEMLVSKKIESLILKTYKSFGYEMIKTPTLEYEDVYSFDGRKKDLYNLINRQGEVLALCNDMTSSIARFVGSNKALEANLLKYCYVADTFRYPRLYQGKNHQFLQAGIEIISDQEFESDVECLYLAFLTLKKCNIDSFKVHLGSNEFINLLLEDLNINKNAKNIILEAIAKKNYVLLKNVLNENLDYQNAKFVADLILRGGKLKFIDFLIEKLKDKKACSALVYLKNVYLALEDLGCDNIIFDFSIYTYADYYTGIVFQCYIDGINHEVISGGRSNTLLSFYNKNGKDVGFGVDLDALALYALNNNLIILNEIKYLSISDDESLNYCLKHNNELRDENIIVNHLKLDLDLALKYAKTNGYSKVIVYENNTFRVVEV